MRPSFFIVGAPKSGTTSLHYYLSQHPEIFMPKFKEINFFAKDQIEEQIQKSSGFLNKFSLIPKSVDEYLSYYTEAKNEKIAGECTPWYMTSKVDAKEIYNFNPNSKIILIIREPVQLLHSLHSQLLYVNIENEKDFIKALKSENIRRKHGFKTHYRTSFIYYSNYIKYDSHIKKYKNYFSNNLHLILFDDFKNNFDKTFQDLLKFLEVDSSFKPKKDILNKNKIARYKFLQNPNIKIPITKLIPKNIRPFVSKIYKKINTKTVKRKSLPEKNIKLLKTQFKPEVELINKYFEKDLLKLWNYL